jgi:hypothetical protein
MEEDKLIGWLVDWQDELEEIKNATLEVAAVFDDCEESQKLERMVSITMSMTTDRIRDLSVSIRKLQELLCRNKKSSIN